MLMAGKISYGKHSEGLKTPCLYARIYLTSFYKLIKEQNEPSIFTVCTNIEIILADT
jgi:hypothetical protein